MLLSRLKSAVVAADPDGKADSKADGESAVRTLLSENGAFARDPAPVALMRGDGTVLSGNESFSRAAKQLKDDGTLDHLVREAASSGTQRHGTVELTQSASGDEIFWELDVLPLPGGDTVLVQTHDVTRDRTLRDALVDSRKRYKDLVEVSSDFVWEVGASGKFEFVSPGGALGYSAAELVHHHPSEFVPSNHLDVGTLPFLAREPVTDIDVWFHRADGSTALLIASATPMFGEKGAWIGARGVCRDATEDRERDGALAAAQTREKLLAYVTRSIHDEIDPSKMLNAAAEATARALSSACCKIYQVSPSGDRVRAAEYGAAAADDSVEGTLLAQTTGNSEPVMAADADRHLMVQATTYRKQANGAISVTRKLSDGGWTGDEVVLAREIATQIAIAIEQIEYHTKLEKLSRTDELTGLLNRRAFFEELEARIGHDRVSTSPGALFFVDLDNFKLVNDVHGHHRGDEALIAVSKILTDNTRPGDLVSRFGGDEFALWFDRTDETSAAPRALELLGAAKALDEFSGDEVRRLGFSVGIAVWIPGSGESEAGLTGRADEAMYEIKKGSKGGFVLAAPYDPDQTAVSREASA
ncbi:MAG: diguanylate cyclase [Rhodospirillales bacterium]|nr:diguanylate cyclase [Rhodospirillales bacterium]